MRKNLFSAILIFIFPSFLFAQGKLISTTDKDVEKMEANRKTTAPFSILFKENTSFTLSDISTIFVKYLGIRNNIDELRLKNTDINKNVAVSHFQQYFKGIKVEHGSYTVTQKDDRISFITGDFYTIDANTNTQPIINETEALQKALAHVNAIRYKWQQPIEEDFIKKQMNDSNASYYPKGSLTLVENFMANGNLNGHVRLAYKFDIYAQQPISRSHIYVDASTGEILLDDATIKHLGNKEIIDTHNAVDVTKQTTYSPSAIGTAATKYSGTVNIPTRLIGSIYKLIAAISTEGYPLHTLNMLQGTNYGAAVDFTDVDNNWTAAEFNNATFDNVALDAHWGAGVVYDYWKNIHGRSSFDNAGAIINSYVHLDVNYNNAYWDGFAMNYGDGTRVNGGFLPLTALDVCGHEIGHAVNSFIVGAGAGLTYNRESGALNEGFSDIWGAAIEHYGDPHEADATAKSYFDIGEEIGLPLPTPIRSMSNPKLHGQPDTYLGTNWVNATTAGCPTPSNTNDQCGVHTNSGVLNKWFYLLVSGGSGVNDNGATNGTYNVTGIGWADAEQLTFLAEQNLAATADYAACRTATINAATTLFGGCSAKTAAVIKAWYAVGVGANYIACAGAPQIRFKNATINVSEASGTTSCPGTKNIDVVMLVDGVAPTGGNATATITAAGTATNGQDYTIATGTVTFNAGSTSDQKATLSIIDDAAIEGNETIILNFNYSANGSNAIKASSNIQTTVNIIDDDKAPQNGSNTTSNAVGSYTTNSNISSLFKSATMAARSQFLFSAAELIAAGVIPNQPITSMTVNVVSKNSANPYVGYTVSLANTTQPDLSIYYAGAFVTAFTGNLSTTSGNNTITFSTPFTWDGTSNIVMQTCFTNTTAAAAANDLVQGYTTPTASEIYTAYSTGTTGACSLSYNAANISSTRPLIFFNQTIPPTSIETAISTRVQPITNGSTTYFYSTPSNKLITSINSSTLDLSCATMSITATGNNFTALPAGFSGANRSNKEFSITPTTNAATSNYNVTIYYDAAELAGKTPSTLLLVKTNAATDAAMTNLNTKMVVPTVFNGTNYKGFSANFTGFSRFFLIDKPATVLPLNGLVLEASLRNNDIAIEWKTASEFNTAYFIVERSYDGINFSSIKQLPASGFSISEKQYSTIDDDKPQSINYYRIKTVNINGSIQTSVIVTVRLSNKGNLLSISPNLVENIVNIQYGGSSEKNSIYIIDAVGNTMTQFVTKSTNGNIAIDISNYASGLYLVIMNDNKNNTITEKFVKK